MIKNFTKAKIKIAIHFPILTSMKYKNFLITRYLSMEKIYSKAKINRYPFSDTTIHDLQIFFHNFNIKKLSVLRLLFNENFNKIN